MALLKKLPKALLLAGACLSLSGCLSILAPPPPQLYSLSPKSAFEEGLPDVKYQLLVEVPVTSAGLDTSRIAISEAPLKLDYFTNVSWTDAAPRMVQRLMVESFENSDKIISVGRQNIGLRADYMLKSELREFQFERFEGQQDRVLVRLNLKLVAMPRRAILASKSFTAVARVDGANFDNIIQAYDQALGDVLKDAIGWSLKEGQKDALARGLYDRPSSVRPPSSLN